MAILARLKSLIRNFLGQRRTDEDIDAEVRGYAEILAEEKMRDGMQPDEARRAARIELGGVEQVKEQVREARTGAWLDSLLQDLRYGARMLRKNPGFTLIAVLTLALGIGANAAIFTLTYAVILKSLPVPNPQQLVRYTFRNGDQDIGFSGPLYESLRKQETTSQDLLAWTSTDFAISENGATQKVRGALMSGNGFRVLELQPFLGRSFSEADDVPGGGSNGYQALLGYTYWKEHFQANPNVIGRLLAVQGKSATIVGVLPEGFEGLVAGQRVDVVLPLAFDYATEQQGGAFWLTVMGRLKPGESFQTANANLKATEPAVREGAGSSHAFLTGFFAPFHIGVESGRSGLSVLKIRYSRPLIVLEILVALLLLLCCANASLLVLARVSSRMREFAVRSALGAPRQRLFRQVLIEISLLSICGLAAGIMFGWGGAKVLVSMLAAIGQPPPLDVTPQVTILAFTAAISVLATLAVGTWPAVRASRIAPLLDLKQAAGMQRKSVGVWIVPAQVAVSMTLLAAASLLGGSFLHLLLQDSGFRSDGVAMADVDLSTTKPDAATSTRYAQQMAEALGRMPGIQAAAAMSIPPIHDWWNASHYFSLAQNGAVHSDMNLWVENVTPGYFSAMGTPIREGRAFASADAAGEHVCILSASAAGYFFPGEEAIGRFVYSGGADPAADGKTKIGTDDTFRVIGVAADARFRSLHEAPPRMMYALARTDEIGSDFFIVARGSSPGAMSGAIREVARQIAPGAAQPNVFTFHQLVASHLSRERMLMGLSGCFAGIALLLTVMGLYGLLTRSVVVRTKEIGLRLALGARPRDALALVLRQGLRLVAVGAVIGLAAAFAVTRLLGSLLFGVSATNPLILAGVVAVLFGVALAASCIPAWRASRIDPMEALRYE